MPELLCVLTLLVFPTVGRIVEIVTDKPISWEFLLVYFLFTLISIIIVNRLEK
jgi:hypothetical protein